MSECGAEDIWIFSGHTRAGLWSEWWSGRDRNSPACTGIKTESARTSRLITYAIEPRDAWQWRGESGKEDSCTKHVSVSFELLVFLLSVVPQEAATRRWIAIGIALCHPSTNTKECFSFADTMKTVGIFRILRDCMTYLCDCKMRHSSRRRFAGLPCSPDYRTTSGFEVPPIGSSGSAHGQSAIPGHQARSTGTPGNLSEMRYRSTTARHRAG